MESVAKILLLGYTPYQIKDERTGAVTSGTTVRYLFWGENGEALTSAYTNPDTAGGVAPAKVSLPYDSRIKIGRAPAIYSGSFVMSVGSDGKPVLKLNDLEYLQDIDFTAAVAPAAPKK